MRENVINKNSTDEGRIKKNRMDEVAVLIPCYNESKTIEKVVTDFRRELPDAVFMCMIIIRRITQLKSQSRQVQLFVMNTNREKEML